MFDVTEVANLFYYHLDSNCANEEVFNINYIIIVVCECNISKLASHTK